MTNETEIEIDPHNNDAAHADEDSMKALAKALSSHGKSRGPMPAPIKTRVMRVMEVKPPMAVIEFDGDFESFSKTAQRIKNLRKIRPKDSLVCVETIENDFFYLDKGDWLTFPYDEKGEIVWELKRFGVITANERKSAEGKFVEERPTHPPEALLGFLLVGEWKLRRTVLLENPPLPEVKKPLSLFFWERNVGETQERMIVDVYGAVWNGPKVDQMLDHLGISWLF